MKSIMTDMSRLVSARSAAALMLFAAFAALGGCDEGDDRPNVLVVIIDTLRADHLGCYGARTGATPNMDRLAAEGVRFSTCVSAVPVTLPSVSTIITSAYPPYHGVRDNSVFTLDHSLITLAEVFNEAGYATGAVVGAHVISKGTGVEQGFDHFDSDFGDNYAKESSLEPGKAREVGETQRRAGEVTDRALEWLEEERRPFFLLVHYFDPHWPYDPPPEFGRRFSQSIYVGEVGYTDSRLGLLLDAAEEAAGESDLIIALIADHGEGLGEHDEEQHGYLIYDSTLLVPFIVSYPGVVAPGLRVDEQTSTTALSPTVLELAGLPVPEEWQGTSHAREIRVGGSRKPPRRPCYIETYRTRYSFNWSELVGIRHNGWKMIRAPKPELYDLTADPKELENLYGKEPGRVETMEQALDEMLAAIRGPLDDLQPARDIDEEEVRMLKTLGYVMSKTAPPEGELPDPKDMVAELNTGFKATRIAYEAKALLARGDAAGAEELLLQALGVDPENTVALHDLGLMRFERGEREEGLKLLKGAARLSKTDAVPHLNLAVAYMLLERYGEALEEFERSLAIAPKDPNIRHKYGKALETTGQTNEALQQYYMCLERDPDMRIAQYDAAVLLARTGQHARAKALLEDLIRKNPSDSWAVAARKMLEMAP